MLSEKDLRTTRFEVAVDSDLLEGLKKRFRKTGLDVNTVVNAFLHYVAIHDQLPFDSHISEADKMYAKAAAMAMKNMPDDVKTISSQKDLDSWYSENGEE